MAQRINGAKILDTICKELCPSVEPKEVSATRVALKQCMLDLVNSEQVFDEFFTKARIH
jgi:hypothetical protein